MKILHETLHLFRSGSELDLGVAEPFFDALTTETDERLLTHVLTAWERKGTTENELFAMARIMRHRCIRVNTNHIDFVDAVGTGGSKAKTFNVSTAAAFVIAGAGVPVAKHGNRAATSSSGSADVLAALGVNPSVDAAKAGECLDEIGICFMFAPNFHALSQALGKVRRGLDFPTIFNNLGPLCNPASAPHQVIGVWKKELVEKTANVLLRLGTKKSWIVHGCDGLDEITLNGPTTVAEIENGSVNIFDISVNEFGIDPSKMLDLQVSTAAESAELIQNVFNGKCENRDAVNLVAINAAAAIHVASPGIGTREAFNRANESIVSGSASRKLRQLAEMTSK